MKVRSFIAAMLIAVIPSLGAASYPDRQVNVVVGFGPGGINDIVARIISKELAERLGQAFVINNRAGAGGTIGADMVANAAPDGYTLVLGSVSNIVIAPLTFPSVPYDSVKSFSPVALVGGAPNILVVNSSSSIRTMGDLIEVARSKPGQVTYASAGIGTSNHLTGELLQEAANIELMHVPYKGDSQALLGLIGGETQFMFATIPAAINHIKSGKLRAVAVASAQRTDLAPEVPTVSESGIKDFVISVWVGFLAPAGTPQDIVDKLSREIQQVTEMESVKKSLREQGVELGVMNSAEFSRAIKADMEKWRPVATKAAASMKQ